MDSNVVDFNARFCDYNYKQKLNFTLLQLMSIT